jgi:hypothetical protein
MSWNGTVTCSHCYEQGHNRRTCPHLKAQIARRLEENPDDHYAKYLKERNERGKVRRCTYCNLKGHNRRTCPELAQQKQQWREKTAAWRLKFIKWAVSNGVGPGALVKSSAGWNSSKVRLVKEFCWRSLNHDDQLDTGYPGPAVHVCSLNMKSDGHLRMPHIEEICGEQDEYKGKYHSGGFEVVSPVRLTEEAIVKYAPQWWLDGKDKNAKDDLKDRFADRKSPNHYDNQFEN